MSPQLPDGMRWPQSGAISSENAQPELHRPLSIYVHVPFCRVRCGYCDFNTYTVGFGPGADRDTYADSVSSEISLAARVLDEAGLGQTPARTVFFGGGTPTMLDTSAHARMLHDLADRIGIAQGAEVTCEANPETVDEQSVKRLADAGVTRLSVGMQSVVPRILHTLDRQHRPERVGQVIEWARAAGLDVSVDIIYGTPGESLDDWATTVQAACDLQPDHISAYALVIEDGTKMAAQVAHGQLPMPDPDDEADKYELLDQMIRSAGYRWYEISNFAREEADEAGLPATELRHASRHNLAYWRDWNWWGFGPGAHSHIGRARWWNVKHPRAWAGRLRSAQSPAAAGEILDDQTRYLERVLLRVRTSDGIALGDVAAHAGRENASQTCHRLRDEGLLDSEALERGHIALTLRGRLLADYVTRELTD